MKYNFEIDLNHSINTNDLAQFLQHVLKSNGAEVNAVKFKHIGEVTCSDIQDVKDVFE